MGDRARTRAKAVHAENHNNTCGDQIDYALCIYLLTLMATGISGQKQSQSWIDLRRHLKRPKADFEES